MICGNNLGEFALSFWKLTNNRIVKNMSWLMAGKIIHVILGFFISLLTARYLGPGNYGLINYATAYTTFFASICTLGINSIIVKNFIDYPEEEGETLGTSIVLRIIASILSLGVICVIVRLIDQDEKLTQVVVGLYSISLVLQTFEIFRQWFQVKLLSKYYAIATLVSYLVSSFYKIILLAKGKSVEWFAIANSVDYLLVAILLYGFYKKSAGPKLSFSIRKARELLAVSCSYILVGMMTAIYASTDKLMLKQLLGEEQVGFYALALSISSMWTFILSAFIESFSPTIMACHNEHKGKYIIMCKRLYAVVFYTSVIASLGIYVIAPLFIRYLYGEQYLASVAPLRIIVWYVAFSYLGVARNVWVVCEKKQKYLKYLYLGSALCNVILNFLLIPKFGANGAAVASVLTQISTIFVTPLFIKDFHPNVRMMVDAILLKDVLPTKKVD